MTSVFDLHSIECEAVTDSSSLCERDAAAFPAEPSQLPEPPSCCGRDAASPVAGPSSLGAEAAVVGEAFRRGRDVATTVSETPFIDFEVAADLVSFRDRDVASTTAEAPFFAAGASTADETFRRGKDAAMTVSEPQSWCVRDAALPIVGPFVGIRVAAA